MKSYLNTVGVSRGIRNNNPGNLIKTNIAWQGKINPSKDANFEQFSSLFFGIRAMYKDVINDINKGKNTISKLITEYAPPHENNTNGYIEKVAKGVNMKPDELIKTVDTKFLLLLGRSIVNMENGKDGAKVTDTDLLEAIKMLGNVSTEKLTVNITDETKKKLINKILLYGVAPLGLFFLFFISVKKPLTKNKKY